MTRGYFLCAQRLGIIEQYAEFYVLITNDAGVGSAAAGVFLPAPEQDGLFEDLAAVQHVVMYTEEAGGSPGLGDGIGPAARSPRSGLVTCVQLQGDSYDLEALFQEQKSRDA
jgi:hypothetical protein